ncbi:MAG: DUF1289 domain-containing protein [Gallionellaceae bacterium]
MHPDATPKPITAECPCVGHCTTVLGDDVCRSCHRTFEEVIRWLELSDEERIQINRRIAEEHSSSIPMGNS